MGKTKKGGSGHVTKPGGGDGDRRTIPHRHMDRQRGGVMAEEEHWYVHEYTQHAYIHDCTLWIPR